MVFETKLRKGFIYLAAAAAFLVGAGSAGAQISYQGGQYTNLCGGGEGGSYYNCDAQCDAMTGECRGTNNGVVKWVCDGKATQCNQQESSWANSQKIDASVGCGKTVQVSSYDRKCRKADGGWDNRCTLKGYMVWYSGDCNASQSQLAVQTVFTASPSGTLRITPTMRPTATPTIHPTSGVSKGGVNEDATDSASPVSDTTPETGWSLWIGILACITMGYTGWRLRKFALTI